MPPGYRFTSSVMTGGCGALGLLGRVCRRGLFLDRRQGAFQIKPTQAIATALLMISKAGARRNEPSHDHVLLQPAQMIARTTHRGLGEHARGLLERGGRNE